MLGRGAGGPAGEVLGHRQGGEGGLVLLLGDVGLVGALWCVRGQWTDAPIGRA